MDASGDSTSFGCDDFRDHDSRGTDFSIGISWVDTVWGGRKLYNNMGFLKVIFERNESLIANQVGVVEFWGGLLGDLKDAVQRV